MGLAAADWARTWPGRLGFRAVFIYEFMANLAQTAPFLWLGLTIHVNRPSYYRQPAGDCQPGYGGVKIFFYP